MWNDIHPSAGISQDSQKLWETMATEQFLQQVVCGSSTLLTSLPERTNLFAAVTDMSRDHKSLSRPMLIVLLLGQQLWTPVGHQWFQVIEKQKKSIRMSHHWTHDHERRLGSASYKHGVWLKESNLRSNSEDLRQSLFSVLWSVNQSVWLSRVNRINFAITFLSMCVTW